MTYHVIVGYKDLQQKEERCNVYDETDVSFMWHAGLSV